MSFSMMFMLFTLPWGQDQYPYAGGGQSYEFGEVEYPNVAPGAYGEPLYPYDSQERWIHGYFQRIPAYRGHEYFLPYNYKQLLGQSQAAAGWGMSPTHAYSQQFWHRYHQQATMGMTSTRQPYGPMQNPPAMMVQQHYPSAPVVQQLPVPQRMVPQQAVPTQTIPVSGQTSDVKRYSWPQLIQSQNPVSAQYPNVQGGSY